MSDLSEQFVSEARDLIALATDELIAIERDGVAAERIDRLLRAFHTLKGSARGIGLMRLAAACERAEDEASEAALMDLRSILDETMAALDAPLQ